jgi:hypothetical protein
VEQRPIRSIKAGRNADRLLGPELKPQPSLTPSADALAVIIKVARAADKRTFI